MFRKYLQKTLIFLLKNTLLLVFKIIGPPRILQFGWPINAAILRAFGAKVSKTRVYIHSPVILHGARGGYANAVVNRDVPDNCFMAGVPARLVKEIK
jgi:hypothetical protein